MKKLIFLLFICLCSLGYGQVVIDLDKTYIDSTWVSIEVDTLYLAKDSIYLTASGDTLKIIADTVLINGMLMPTGTYTSNVIDFSNVTIDHTGSNGPVLIRAGTYGSPMTNADEDQSGLIRMYTETSADGTSYDRGVFVTGKTSGTKNVMPIAGLAEILAQSGDGPTNVHAGEFIVDMISATAALDTTVSAAWAGMAGIWTKVTSKTGSVTAAESVVASIWADNQMNGTVNGEEYAFYITSGTKPDAVFGFEASSGSGGWDQLFYFDETTYNKTPVANASLMTLLNATQYYIPLSTSSTAFVYDSLEVGRAIIDDTLFFAYDSTYIAHGADSIKFVVDDTEALRLQDVGGVGQALFDDGTAALPSMSFISEPNTGFYLQGVGDLAISIGGNIITRFGNSTLFGATNSYKISNTGLSSTVPIFTFRSDENTGVSHTLDSLSLIAGGVEGIRIAEGGGQIKVTITDTLNIPDLASANTLVLSPTSTGNVDTLETSDISEITIDTLDVDHLEINSTLVPDADDGANIGLTGTRFNLVYADSVHAAWFGGSDFELGESGSDVTIDADTVKGAPVWSGDLSVTDTLKTVGYVLPGKVIHSYMAFDDSSTTLTMSTGVWAQVTNATDSIFGVRETSGMTYVLGDTLRIDRAGGYKGVVSLSFSGTASDNYEIAIFKNGSIATPKMERSTSQTDVGNVSLPVYIENLVSGDKLTFEMRNTASDDDATVISCSWWIELAHL